MCLKGLFFGLIVAGISACAVDDAERLELPGWELDLVLRFECGVRGADLSDGQSEPGALAAGTALLVLPERPVRSPWRGTPGRSVDG
jgi:hypothetical protein